MTKAAVAQRSPAPTRSGKCSSPSQGMRKMLDLRLRVYATRRCRACWRGLLSRRPGSFFKEMNHQGKTDPRIRFSGGGTMRLLLHLRVLGLDFLQDCDVAVGVFPDCAYAMAADTRCTDFAGASTIV